MIKKNNQNFSLAKGTKIISKIIKAGKVVYENIKALLISGIPPLTLLKSIGNDLEDYKIYGNSIQDGTPTPDTPVEIQSVGDITRNLYDFFDNSKLDRLDYNATTQRWGHNLGVLPAGDYTIRFELVDENEIPASVYIRAKSSTGTLSTAITLTTSDVRNNPATFTATGDSEYYFMFASGSVSSLAQAVERMEMFKWVQLENGKKATEYEPYGYKIPVTVTPASIYDFNSEKIDLYPLTDTETRYGFDLGVLEAGNYIININFVIPEQFIEYLYLRYRDKDGKYSDYIYVTTMANLNPKAFTADGSSHYYLYFASKLVSSLDIAKEEWTKVKSAYLQKSSVFESSLTDIYVKEPLRKIGDYVDYIDFEKQEEIRNITRIYADDTITYRSDISSNSVFNGEWCTFQLNISLKDTTIGYSNRFAQKSYHLFADYIFWLQTNKTYITFNLKKSDIGATSESTNAEILELGKQYVANNPIYFDVVTEEQRKTIKLPNIPTYKGTTILEVDTKIQPSNMEVVYHKK